MIHELVFSCTRGTKEELGHLDSILAFLINFCCNLEQDA